jgi:hypothetical protein
MDVSLREVTLMSNQNEQVKELIRQREEANNAKTEAEIQQRRQQQGQR